MTSFQADKLAFILSTGRTGTKFLATYFNANFDSVTALHEPQLSYHLRAAANAYVAGAVKQPFLHRLLYSARIRHIQRAESFYIESNPWLWGFFDALTQLEPRPIIIHVVRDPRTYVRSTIRHGNLQGLKQIANAIVPYWYVPVNHVLNGKPQTPVGRFAAKWRLVNGYLQERGTDYEGYFLVKFEELFDADETGVQQVCAAFGLPYPGQGATVSTDNRINRGKLKDLGQWQEWPQAWRQELHTICSPLMQEFGYGNEAEWIDSLGSL